MSKTKPFTIGRQQVMNAYLRVRANKGRGGVDEMSLEMFGKDYKNHLYKIWNQMSSGSYIPPPVMLVEIRRRREANLGRLAYCWFHTTWLQFRLGMFDITNIDKIKGL